MNKHVPKIIWIWLGIVVAYFATRLIGLTQLPVFADESIYIRWTQLIVVDWKQYLFFPLNDGKTPLWMWLMIPTQLGLTDPVWGARFLSVLVGGLQLGATVWLIRRLGGSQRAQIISALGTIVLPFWFFHHRLALIDNLLTVLLTLSLIAVTFFQVKKFKLTIASILNNLKQNILPVGFLGISIGLALWSKIPAVLFLPIFLIWPLRRKNTWMKYLGEVGLIGTGIFAGLLIFVSLKLHPAFGQLFGRGSDFLYPVSEVLAGKWQQTLINVPTYINYFLTYLTWPVMLLPVIGLFSKRWQRTSQVLFWSWILFVAPIAVLGIVVYPRYLFPSAIFLTVSASLVLDLILAKIQFRLDKQQLVIGTAASMATVLLIAQTAQFSGIFMITSWFVPNSIPLVSADTTQYLTEWSSGHGLIETKTLIDDIRQDESVAVATEGYFGTLPDGLLLYYHLQDVDNLYIEGVGQPVGSISQQFASRVDEFDRVLLVVNSHRLDLDLPADQLLGEYCRPFAAPCLQVWDITEPAQAETLPIAR